MRIAPCESRRANRAVRIAPCESRRANRAVRFHESVVAEIQCNRSLKIFKLVTAIGVGMAKQGAVDKKALLVLGEIRAVPPSAAESLKESRCIGIAIGLSLNEANRCLLTG